MKIIHKNNDDLRQEYDFTSMRGVRGKYFKEYRKGTNLVALAPDVARAFPDANTVNDALRALMKVSKALLVHSR